MEELLTHSKKNIFLYNKRNELITYVDLDDNRNILSYYNLQDNTLTKYNISKFLEKNKWKTDIKKAKIVFDEECKLFHMFDGDESYCKAIKKNSLKIDSPLALSKIYSHNNEQLEGYTVKPSMIQDWLKKL